MLKIIIGLSVLSGRVPDGFKSSLPYTDIASSLAFREAYSSFAFSQKDTMNVLGNGLLNKGHGDRLLPSDQKHTGNRSKLDYGPESLMVSSHPLRVKPLGNMYISARNIKSSAGHFSSLPDEVIIQLLEFFDDLSLLSFGGTCKALFAFCAFEDLWKALFIGYVV